MENYNYLCFSLYLCIFLPYILCIKLTDVTVDLFHSKTDGIVAAFGDFNADKLTDIFVVDDAGTKVDLLQAEERDPFVRINLIPGSDGSTVITGVIPADFDGDSYMDLLITRKPKGKPDDAVKAQIYWGTSGSPGLGTTYNFTEDFRDQPALIDWDGDMLPDLLAESAADQKRVVWLARTKTEFKREEISGDKLFRKPHSNAFIDVDNDFTADIVMTTEEGYEIWTSKNSSFVLNHTYPLPPNAKLVGQSAFVDIASSIDQDGMTDHLVPVCEDEDCSKSVIYIYSKAQNTWIEFFSKFTDADVQWAFVPPASNLRSIQYPITLRTGDYNMDGFPDAIVFLRAKQGKDGGWLQKAVLLQNVGCSGSLCSPAGRTFSADWNSDISRVDDVTSGSFFDFYDDGVLDMILVAMTTKPHHEDVYYPQIRAYKQTPTADTCFVKVLVTSGHCYKDCKDGRSPYGVNVPGPSVKYKTTSVEGDVQHSCAGQLSQSAHFALQLPFTVFGLGQTPNFIDSIGVGIPSKSGQMLERTWTQIIPNSQLVVIPHPHNKTSWWVMKLFATPSRLVLITGAVLIGTMGFVAGIIGILHWRERREDMKEKRQESHKFHFDAM